MLVLVARWYMLGRLGYLFFFIYGMAN